jgi:hypothetical protein
MAECTKDIHIPLKNYSSGKQPVEHLSGTIFRADRSLADFYRSLLM